MAYQIKIRLHQAGCYTIFLNSWKRSPTHWRARVQKLFYACRFDLSKLLWETPMFPYKL